MKNFWLRINIDTNARLLLSEDVCIYIHAIMPLHVYKLYQVCICKHPVATWLHGTIVIDKTNSCNDGMD